MAMNSSCGVGLLPRALASALVLVAGMAAAQTYPSRPIRFIVPFPPGGGTDLNARTIEPKLGEALRQQIVIDNRAGAGGMVGAELAARAPADGHTIWIGQTANLVIGPALRKKNPYDPLADFTMITPIQRASSVVVVSPSSPLKSITDLVAFAKKNPQGATYASAGIGTGGHINGILLNKAAGIDMTHIAYKGASPAMVDLQGNRVTVMFTSIGSSAGMIRQGKIRAIGTSGLKRARALPEVPTIAEQGYPDFEVNTWTAVLVPAKTPEGPTARLNREIVQILGIPEVQEKLRSEGGDVSPMSLPEAAKFFKSEVAVWKLRLKDSNIPIE
jgi:tripartite-type tricarboxylate transporter receptor subunit TctC